MQVRSLHTVDEVIDALGGTAVTARLTGRSLQAVSNWRFAKRLPADLFLLLSRALSEKGATAPPSLWGMEPDRVAS
jgi:hypothetical protein